MAKHSNCNWRLRIADILIATQKKSCRSNPAFTFAMSLRSCSGLICVFACDSAAR
ncbi:hypothetical protein BGCPKDLD_4359 [Methylorubrum suomiense]|uniref:Uncharacterized protein n=1 Tax=Methylorubrum suomiense TaxID=144191 RepID=A0ABQ4V4Y6_9HYPH|nr:hypothetical protein BGCPKDLD_4359 [Methylorubrum suomiense]